MPFLQLRKRRTREHVIADLSINYLERQALLCGFSIERIRLDYGIDLIVHSYNHRGEIENGRILFQVKATNRIKASKDGSLVVCRIEKADLLYWVGESMPVILVQYDAQKNEEFWIHVQEHVKGLTMKQLGGAGRRMSINIARANLLDSNAIRLHAQIKNNSVIQLREHYNAD